MADAQFLRKPGSTLCICGTSYKNNAVPPSCTSEGCGYQLGKKLREGVKITCRNLPNCLKEGFEKTKKRNFPQKSDFPLRKKQTNKKHGLKTLFVSNFS